MLEVFIVCGVLFFIAVLFYKQANEQFEILKLDAERLQELPTLYADRAPIVVSGFQQPALGTEASFQKRPHILQMAVAPSLSLRALLGSEGSLKAWTWNPETAKFLSKESGLDIWFQHNLYETILPSPYLKFLYSYETSLWPHHRGLFKTKASQTILMPTQGTLRVSLLLQKMIPFLPTKWEGKRFEALTQQDTPLLNQIQFMDIILRPGNILFLPPHLLVSFTSELNTTPSAWTFLAEIHHPISKIA
jgi:hypothetical protein